MVFYYWAFFLSGLTALAYQILWVRQLTLVFGNTTQAVAAILTIFFAGLSLGSLIFGRLAKNNAGRWFGLTHLGVGLYALVTPFVFQRLIFLQAKFGLNDAAGAWLMAFLALIIPAILMGGWLALVGRLLITDSGQRGQLIGRLYAWNNFGAVLGVFLTGFFLIRYLGVKETTWLIATINIFVGVLSLRLAVRHDSLQPQAELPEDVGSQMALVVFGINGLAALALEVLWTRVLILTFGASTYAFSLILMAFLIGLGLGSAFAGRFLAAKQKLTNWLAGIEAAIGLSVVLFTPILGRLPLIFLDLYHGKTDFAANLWLAFGLSLLIMLIPTFLMGVTWPLLAKILTPQVKKFGQQMGSAYAVNTLGGVLGAFLAGAVLIRFLGLQKGIWAVGITYWLAGGMLALGSSLNKKVRILVIVLVGLLSWGVFRLPSWNRHIMASGAFVYFDDYYESKDALAAMSKGEMVFYKETPAAVVMAKKDQGNLYLRINGKTDASTTVDREDFLLMGHLPMLLHQNPQKVLVVGLGSGTTLGAIEHYPVSEIDLVEIEPAVIEAAQFFGEDNYQALSDPRLKIIVGDGRHYLLTTGKKYDVISSHPSNPWVAGIGNLFAQEYFQLMASRLGDDGVALHWIQLYLLSAADLKTAIATFQRVFPYVTVWSSPLANDLILIGSKKPVEIDMGRLERAFADKAVSPALAEAGVASVAELLSYFAMGSKQLESALKNIPLNTDNHPRLEFSAPFSLGQKTIGKNLAWLLTVQEPPFEYLATLSDIQKQALENKLMAKTRIFQAKIALEAGNLSESIRNFEEALTLDPGKQALKKEAAKAYFYQAEEAFGRQDFSQAEQSLERVVQLDESNVLAYSNLGAIYYERGDLLGAAKYWQQAAKIDPDRPEVKHNLELIKLTL